MLQTSKLKKIALVGVPNSGKTSLFNQLTQSNQRIGNWSGVTVEKKEGRYTYENKVHSVIDLPGLYTFNRYSKEMPLDEKISCDFLLSGDFDVALNVIDVTSLERQLYLTRQLLEHKIPVVIVLNHVNKLSSENLKKVVKKLKQEFYCDVLYLEELSEKGCLHIKKYIRESIIINQYEPLSIYDFQTQSFVRNHQKEIEERLNKKVSLGFVMQLLEGDIYLSETLGIKDESIADKLVQGRIRVNSNLSKKCKIELEDKFTTKLDSIVLDKFLGVPIFLIVMYTMFVFSIKVGGLFQNFFDLTTQVMFMDSVELLLSNSSLPAVITGMLHGVGQGLNVTLTFIPIIGAMFLFLSFLEATGYIARAAFLVDRLMQFIGLPGKAFVPMIIGFGCNVPSILGTRTLNKQKERIITIMMSPFMSCGARMAIYTMFVAAFFPENGHNIIFALYLIGIIVAIFTGKLLQDTVLNSEYTPSIMELPKYRLPSFKVISQITTHRLKKFVKKAGKLIVPICVFVGGVSNIGLNNNSLVVGFGKAVTPIFAPMGISEDNWPATVGLLSGVLAKEVVVGTLTALYDKPVEEDISISEKMNLAISSLHPKNLFEKADYEANVTLFKSMYEKFGSQAAAFSYLLFVLLYVPCISVVASISKELNRKWAAFSVFWTFYIAYAVSTIFYQLTNFQVAPVYSIFLISGLLASFYSITHYLKNFYLIQKNKLV